MKRFLILFCVVALSCSASPEDYIEHLNGYWEIEQVKLANGTKRQYGFNTTVDYFNISDNLTGFRKKLKPNLQGTYETSEDFETLNLKIEDNKLIIYYKTLYDTWKETVLFANSEELKIINQNKGVYLYKRFKPINID